MEGTRNERSVLIIISYIIGFVTAFIFYGTSESQEELLSGSEISYVNQETMKPDDTETIASSDAFYLESSDNKNTFVCRSEMATDYCTAYIVSNDTQTETPVLLDNQTLTMNKDLLAGVEWSDGVLAIHDIASASTQTPWLLVSTNTPIDLQ